MRMRDTVEAATAASDALGDLNHALAGGELGVADVYRVVGNLVVLTGRLEQSCRELDGVLARRVAAGGLGWTDVGSGVVSAGPSHAGAGAAVDAARADLDVAADLVDRFARMLAAAQVALASVSDTVDGPGEV